MYCYCDQILLFFLLLLIYIYIHYIVIYFVSLDDVVAITVLNKYIFD